MKKILSTIAIAATLLGLPTQQADAQLIYHYYSPYWYSIHGGNTSVANTATVTGGVLGVAAIVSNAVTEVQEIKARKEAAARYAKQKEEAKAKFPNDIAEADKYYNEGNWSMALQSYANCAHNNDNFDDDLGDQDMLITRIAECNAKLGNKADKPCVLNNPTARKSSYSEYTVDIQNPVYKAKKKTGSAQITRVSCNSNETRLEFEYYNNEPGEAGLGIKGDTYIKGKKSGKLKLRKMENITIAPTRTIVPYGHQTLKFTLIFPALNPADETFEFCEPKSDWQFKDVVCK